ncbi:MAG: HD domain-containing protein [bacterium]|nr:HD domain-containing protein [bacterium]
MTSINNSLQLNFNKIQNIPFEQQNRISVSQQFFGNKDYCSDSFCTTEIGLKSEIEALARTSPKIISLLTKYKIPLKVNEDVITDLKKNHLQNTRILVANMYSAMPEDLKQSIDLKSLQEAAMYHDYGKFLIPENILNKKGSLTHDERKIIELHPILGYELLKNKRLSERTMELIKYHHQLADNSGYPKIDSDFDFGIDSQILFIADKFDALTEKRSYKPPFTKQEALDIIMEDVKTGAVRQEVFDALCKAT